ncbi:MAG: TIGR02270 family protein [Candidatus Competibacter denitrificans]
MPATPSNAIKDEITHCIDEAKALWKKRQIGIDAPYFSLRDLANLDSRLNQQLDALRQNSTQSWSLLEQRFTGPQYSLDDLFPATVLAFSETASQSWRGFLIELIGTDERPITAVIETLGWLPLDHIKEPLLQLLAAANPLHQRIALAVCAHHRADAGDYLTAALQSDVPELRACALKAAGEIGRLDLLPALRQHLTAEPPDQRFWAAWSAIRMGERGQITEILGEFALTDSPLYQFALPLLPHTLPEPHRQHWLEAIKDQAVHSRDAITSVGATGDPWQIPWLVAQMQHPELARVAGQAFTLITGLDLVEHQLAQPTANDSPNPKDPMRGLPWPNPDAITTWWQANETRFQRGIRYLLGHPITPDHCLHVLVNGYQRQRAAAALELALIQTGMPLFAVHAPAAEQQELLNIRDTLKTCVSTAAQLWQQRDQAAHAPMTTLPALTELDSRLEQQLTLLRDAGDLGWKCCWEILNDNRQPGTVFAAAATAVSHPADAPFQQITEYINANPVSARELIAALGWVAPDHLRGRALNLLTATSPLLRYIGLTACGLHQVDPGHYLDAALKDSGLRLRARALRLVGELRLQRYLPILQQQLHHPNETWRFWAAWSAGLLGDSRSLEELQKLVEGNTEPLAQQRAVALLARALDMELARSWIRQLLVDGRMTALVIYGLGVLGDASVVPWLIHCMSGPTERARLAGIAFSLITGADLLKENLVTSISQSPEPVNDDQPAGQPLLPPPDANAVSRWWNQQRRRYKKDRCYLMGFPFNPEVCWQVLVHGRQCQRTVAAIQVALIEPETALFPIEAPAFRQWQWLSALKTEIPTDIDTLSTLPQQFTRSKSANAEKNNSPSRCPSPDTVTSTLSVRELDRTHTGAIRALAELTQPANRGWLFRRDILPTIPKPQNTPERIATSLTDRPSVGLLHQNEIKSALPEPTTAAILAARSLLATGQIQPNNSASPPTPPAHRDATTPRKKPSPTILPQPDQNRSAIDLSSATSDQYIEYIEIISNLWHKRYTLANARYSVFDAIREIDRYIRPYLEHLPEVDDGLWRKVENLLAEKMKAGHLFAASFIALQDKRIQRLRKVVNTALAQTRIENGFLSVFGWLPPAIAQHKVQLLLNSKFVRWRRLGILAAMANHIDCGNLLEKLVHDSDGRIRALALKAIGKLGYADLMPLLLQNLRSADQEHQFWAAWSAILLANHQDALEILKDFALVPTSHRQQQALQLILRIVRPHDIERWVGIVVRQNHHLCSAMISTGVCNSVSWIPWLIKSMHNPEYASYAGEAFTIFTGVDLIDAGLLRPRVRHPIDKSFESMEPARLLLPDAHAVQDWWLSHQDRYKQDTRYFFGYEISLENCVRILNTGRQYQRAMAALELSLLKAEFPLLETRAASHQQQIWIDQLR